MKPKPPVGVGGIVGLILLAAAVAFVALRPGSIEVVVDDSPPVAPPEAGVAVVTSLRQSGGFSPLGFRITDSTHFVVVHFITDPGCLVLIDFGDPWPTPYAECSGPVEIVGEVGGLGRTMSGDSLIGVQFKVPRACYDLLERGMAWPSDYPECSSES